ncbi:MAG: helix-turn-helix transcriptional regulator [Alphaproteobacteria bacterium]|nr:helix-turn-helix transcriptional regulator [Alphaproteobacteria bacterium]MDD9919028.1 helix-turn-helix transcriptional regulator [Alphaproteobacteria bacterium]
MSHKLGQGYNYYHYTQERLRTGWGGVLKAYREDVLGMHQTELAKKLDITQTMLWRIESGRREMDTRLLGKLITMMNSHAATSLRNSAVLTHELKLKPRTRKNQKRERVPRPEQISVEPRPHCSVCFGTGLTLKNEDCWMCHTNKDPEKIPVEKPREGCKVCLGTGLDRSGKRCFWCDIQNNNPVEPIVED